jgi:D-alanyl-D-alanine carboxypeptidase/D-alanyl-D-alanine-endopeptidase (penicillin-binding protein 4)
VRARGTTRAFLLILALAPTAGAQTAAPAPTLAARIDAIVCAPEFRAARFGVMAVAIDTGETLYARDADRLFMPASNMKLYSTALALQELGPGYVWRTSAYAAARPDNAGRLAGDLVVYGRGDPTISPRFSGGDPLRKIDLLADRVAAAGVRRVEGDLVADESYFTGERFGFGWEWNWFQWGFGAEVSALSVNDNTLTLTVEPGEKPGDPCRVTLSPDTSYARVRNRTRTPPKDAAPDLGVYRPPDANVFDVWGGVPLGAPPYTGTVAVRNPAGLFAQLLRDALARRGVTVAGVTATVDARGRLDRPFAPEQAVELAHLESEPLADVVRETNKESENLYAELLLRTVGRVRGPATAATSEAAGVAVLTAFLRSAGVDPAPLVFSDGSGLSRRTLVTPEATVRLLAFMRRQKTGDLFHDSLPVAGQDGTLKSRFADSSAAGRVRAKTGTLDNVRTLSGYVTSRSGRPIAFSIMVNNQPGSQAPTRKAVDAIATALFEL